MFVHLTFFLFVIVSFSSSQLLTNDRQCLPDTTDFATKVEKSSVVVYGKAMAKIMNDGSDSIFHVFYQVDCILKGPATLRQINITNAGRVQGKQYCQEFPVGRGYSIAFLEPISSDKPDYKTFFPADFAEIREDGNSTSQLLARTCNLHRIVPRQSLASVTDVCPDVGTHPICHEITNTTLPTIVNQVNLTTIILADIKSNSSNTTIIVPGNHEHSNQAIYTPEQEIEMIRSKSGVHQVDTDEKNSAKTTTFGIYVMIIALIFAWN
ncbi:hypothetical protein I4U23_017999 [Adineta vaga]|nr:hypothetical protein I4U23_017999 [Adineta vaga]